MGAVYIHENKYSEEVFIGKPRICDNSPFEKL